MSEDKGLHEAVGRRLREERETIGIGTVAFARLCGFARHTQYGFETGKHLPGGAYLIAAAAHGVDVRYVLTAERSLIGHGPLSATEKRLHNELLRAFGHLSAADLCMLRGLLRACMKEGGAK